MIIIFSIVLFLTRQKKIICNNDTNITEKHGDIYINKQN